MNFMPNKDVSLFRCYIIHRHIDGRFTAISQQVPLSGNEYENVDTKTSIRSSNELQWPGWNDKVQNVPDL